MADDNQDKSIREQRQGKIKNKTRADNNCIETRKIGQNQREWYMEHPNKISDKKQQSQTKLLSEREQYHSIMLNQSNNYPEMGDG